MARGILQQSQAEVETKLHVAVGQAGRGCCDLDHSLCTAVPVGTIGPVHRTCSLKAQDSDCTQVLNEQTICLYYAYIYIHMMLSSRILFRANSRGSGESHRDPGKDTCPVLGRKAAIQAEGTRVTIPGPSLSITARSALQRDYPWRKMPDTASQCHLQLRQYKTDLQKGLSTKKAAAPRRENIDG